MVTFHLPEGRGGAKGRKAFEQVKSDIWFVEVMGMVQNALLDRVIMSSTTATVHGSLTISDHICKQPAYFI